jgi:hypothetical protein
MVLSLSLHKEFPAKATKLLSDKQAFTGESIISVWQVTTHSTWLKTCNNNHTILQFNYKKVVF